MPSDIHRFFPGGSTGLNRIRTNGALSYIANHSPPTACIVGIADHEHIHLPGSPMHSTVSIPRPASSSLSGWPAAPVSRLNPGQEATGVASLPPALNADMCFASGAGPRLALYMSMPEATGAVADLTPLLLVHSVNAAASAAELRPVFERYRSTRPVVAMELPGFGSSQRGPLQYTPPTMADAILRAVKHLRSEGFRCPVDVMAVSLSSEFVARAAAFKPSWFRTLALVSPTGMNSARPEAYDAGRTSERRVLRAVLEMPLWAEGLYRLLTTRASVRYFLKRTWGTPAIDKALLEYDLLTARQPGARHAPLAFISGALFTPGIASLYARLPQPVWVAHGVLGDFTGYQGLSRIGPPSNRTVDVFSTGALPYFQAPTLFASRYEAFLRHAVPQGA